MTLQEYIMNNLDWLLPLGAILTFVGIVYNLISSSKQSKSTDILIQTSKEVISSEHSNLSSEHSNLSSEHSNLSEKLNDIKNATNTVQTNITNILTDAKENKARIEMLSKQDINISDVINNINAMSNKLNELIAMNNNLKEELQQRDRTISNINEKSKRQLIDNEIAYKRLEAKYNALVTYGNVSQKLTPQPQKPRPPIEYDMEF